MRVVGGYDGMHNHTHLAIVSCREELEGGEAVDFDRFDLVGSGVHLRDDDVSTVLVLLTQFLPDRGQLLAVSAPRGIWCAMTKKTLRLWNQRGGKSEVGEVCKEKYD